MSKAGRVTYSTRQIASYESQDGTTQSARPFPNRYHSLNFRAKQLLEDVSKHVVGIRPCRPASLVTII